MLSALALISALAQAPAQGELQLNDVQARHGLHGPVREGDKIPLGDIFVLEWTIKGLKANDTDSVSYSIALEIANSDGRVVFAQEPSKKDKQLTLGGGEVRAFLSSTVGLDTPPGKYTVKVTVEDLIAKAKASFTRTFDVVKQDYGLVRFFLSYDNEGEIPAPAHGVVGQTMQLNCHVIGAKLDKDGNPNLKTTVRVLQDGKEVRKTPIAGVISKAIKEDKLIPVAVGLTLDRAGKYTVELTVEDEAAAGKPKATQSFELNVNALD